MSNTEKRPKLDMLNGSIWNKIPQYALPVAATGILEQLFNASDIAIVGNFTGSQSTASVAAVGANSPVIGLILNLFIGIALGANVVIANAVGRKDKKQIHDAVHTSIVAALLGGVLIAILGELLVSTILQQLNVPAGIQSAVFAIANIVIQAAINSLGTIVIAASSAAFNIEIFAYYIMNSFSQACTTFVSQNYGARQMKRCKKTLALCLIEDAIASAAAILIILFVGRQLLAIFNHDSQVIELGYTRLLLVFTAYIFSMMYELMSGYLRGFGISLVPALLTILGVCGVRIAWVYGVFPSSRTFHTLMMAYPISLSVTAVLIFIALIVYRPSKKLLS